MSHELHLVAGAGEPARNDDFIAALIADGHWRRSASGLRYENPDTGVTADLEPVDTPVLSSAYSSVGMALHLDYVRPSFFAAEVIPTFAKSVASAGMLVVDPQASPGATAPDRDRLRQSWEAGNAAAVAAARSSGVDIAWMEQDRAGAWWRHQRALPQLRLAFAATHYVPALRLVRRAGSRGVERAMTWPDFVPALYPECDLLIIVRSDPVRHFEILGVASAPEVAERLGPLLDEVVLELPEQHHIRRLPPERSPEVSQRLSSITLEPFTDLDDVRPDGFVDVPPDGYVAIRADKSP